LGWLWIFQTLSALGGKAAHALLWNGCGFSKPYLLLGKALPLHYFGMVVDFPSLICSWGKALPMHYFGMVVDFPNLICSWGKALPMHYFGMVVDFPSLIRSWG
jgi:hypothetical protein